MLRGIAVYGEQLKELGQPDHSNDEFVLQSLFATITNANWADSRFVSMILDGLIRRGKLKEVFGLSDINELPVSYVIAWYEQKAVAVLLALLSLGVKGLRLGPTLPGFLSPNVAKVLVDKFNIKPFGTEQEDIAAMMAGN